MSEDVLGSIMDSTALFIVLVTLIVMGASYLSSQAGAKPEAQESATTRTDLPDAA
ncbi:MAG TPA: hypothetical protein VNK46_06440 [Nitrospiraceae bacterium]|jgi:hypothetical protein|nr:hypothetical protein [Nitrospiraceae bacterium]